MALVRLRTFATMEVKDELIDENEERSITQTFPLIEVPGGIVPWNWPVLLGLGKLGPALITENTFIMKPSPFTPYTDLKLGEIGMSIFPPGVFQVISGGDDPGPTFTEHPDIGKISFTGSIATGRKSWRVVQRPLIVLLSNLVEMIRQLCAKTFTSKRLLPRFPPWHS